MKEEEGKPLLHMSHLRQKDEGTLKKRLNKLADALTRLAGKTAEALLVIVGSFLGAILSFLGKADGFVTEHTWDLSAFVAELIGLWLMQKVKNQKNS